MTKNISVFTMRLQLTAPAQRFICRRAGRVSSHPALHSPLVALQGLTQGQKLGRTYRPLSVQTRAASGQQQLSDAEIDEMEKKLADRMPVTIITGFLGSGKTTLVNHILKGNHGKRIAVIENEYGEQDIDGELVAMQDKAAEEIMLLNNGCLCCTVRGDLVKMLNKLYDRRDKFDQVVIETTGLANPSPIIQTFFMEDDVFQKYKIDGLVTLVDAKNIERHLNNDGVREDGQKSEAVEQIAYADRIILNKTDLVTEEDLGRVEKRIRGFNRLARIERGNKANVNLDFVLKMGGFDLERVEEEVNPRLLKKKEPAHSHSHDHAHDHDHEHGESCSHCGSHDHKTEAHQGHEHKHGDSCGHDHGAEAHSHSHAHDHEGCSHCGSHEHASEEHDEHDHVHDELVSSLSLVVDGEMELDKVNRWLGLLLQYRGDDIYRMKGVLAIHGFDKKFVFQGVHTLFEGAPIAPWKEGEARRSRMVFIGRELDKELIRDGFMTCMYKEKDGAAADKP